MKNLVELTPEELSAICGGINWHKVLLTGTFGSGPWCAPIVALTDEKKLIS